MLVAEAIHSWLRSTYNPKGYLLSFVPEAEARTDFACRLLNNDARTYLARDHDGFTQGATIGYNRSKLVCIVWRVELDSSQFAFWFATFSIVTQTYTND